MINRQTFVGLRTDRTTNSGKHCIDIAAQIALQSEGLEDRGGARAYTELLRESRGWVKLALDCDAAAHHAKLAAVHAKLIEREQGADAISSMRTAFQ